MDFTPATRIVLRCVESSKIVFLLGFWSEPRWGSLQCPSDPLVSWGADTPPHSPHHWWLWHLDHR